MEFDYNDTYWDFDTTDYSVRFMYSEIVTVAMSLIGIAGNILLISTILSVKSLQTRPYLLLMNWSICNILYRIFTENLLFILPLNFHMKMEQLCIVINLESIFQFAEIVFLFALISNWAIKTIRMNNLFVIFIFYTLIVTVSIVMISLCVFDIFNKKIQTSLGITYLCLLLTVSVKTVNRICKARVDPLSEETAKRLNLVSIYTVWMMCLLIIIIPLHFYNKFLFIHLIEKSTVLIPYAFIVYLIKVDHVFKSSFLDIIKCRKPQQKPDENIAYNIYNSESVNMM